MFGLFSQGVYPAGVHDRFVRCLSGGVCGSSLPEIFEAPAEQAASQGDDGVGAGYGPAHAGGLEPCADLLASGLDDARGDAQSSGAELRIAHPVAVAEHIVDALSRLWRGLGMGAQRGDERTEPAGVQLGIPALGPRVGQLGPGAVDGLGHVAQMLLGVVDIDDFDGAGKLLSRQTPDPGGAVAKDDTADRGVEAAPLRLAIDALREGGWQRVGVAAGRALDRGVVADRPGVAYGLAVLVAGLSRPHRNQLDLAGPGGAVGLFPAPALHLGWWLWAAVTPTTTVYAICPGRGFDDAQTALGADFDGVLVRDGWVVYRRYTHGVHQSCLQHLRRRCEHLLEDHPHSGWAGQVQDTLQAGLALRDRRNAGDLSDHCLATARGRLLARLSRLIDNPPPLDDTERFAAHLGIEFPAIFTFPWDPSVDATNWRAKQAIRPAVVTRKVCGGNRTRKGADTQQVLASVVRTARQRNLDLPALFAAMLRAPDSIVPDVFGLPPPTA